MVTPRFFWKLYLSSAALVFLTMIGFGALALKEMQRALLEEKESALRERCVAMAPALATFLTKNPDQSAAALLKALGAGPDTRITVMGLDGTVVADSSGDPSGMENHVGRPEVQEALVSGIGVAARESASAGQRMFFVAYRVDGPADRSRAAGKPLGVLRLALPLARIDRQVGVVAKHMILVAAIGASLALILGAIFAHRFAQPLVAIAAKAQNLRSGNYEKGFMPLPAGEFRLLGDALDQLGEEMNERIGALMAEQSRLRAMLAGMVEGVVAVDESDRVAFSNSAARKLLSVGEIESLRLWEVVRVANLDAFLREAREKEKAAQREFVLPDAAGHERTVRAQAHRFHANGRVGVVLVLEDVTELRHLERIRRDFVANVSHELKTPLTSIRGYVETLIDGALDDQENNRRFLEKIEVNVQRLSHLVSDLLSLARIEEQVAGPNLQRIELSPLLEEALRLHESAAIDKGIRIELESSVKGIHLSADRESLLQVVDNLLDNAIKYTLRGGSVLIKSGTQGDCAVLEVSDTGIGIPPEDLERVFERFYRVDKAHSRAVGGTGLGLAIVKHLTLAMGGEVSVESELGQGTVFRVLLARGA